MIVIEIMSCIEWEFCCADVTAVSTEPAVELHVTPFENEEGKLAPKTLESLFYANSLPLALSFSLSYRLALSCSSAMFIYDVNKPLNGRITSAVAVAAIMAATSTATRAALQRRSALSLSQCFMAAGNALLPTHTHAHTLSRRWVALSQESSCFCVKHMWWDREGCSSGELCSRESERLTTSPAPFQCCKTYKFSSFESRSWLYTFSNLILMRNLLEEPPKQEIETGRGRVRVRARGREKFTATRGPRFSLRNIIVYGRLLFEDLDLRPLEWLPCECDFRSASSSPPNPTQLNARSLCAGFMSALNLKITLLII